MTETLTNFSPVEHLHDLVRKEHNKRVDIWFKNTEIDAKGTPKQQLFYACRIKDEDDATTMVMRMWLFEFTIGYAQSLQAPIYGIPVAEHQRGVKFKPQVKLYFVERLNNNDVIDRNNPVTGEITFRLMKEESSTYSRTKAEALAKDIKREFGNPIFVWEKGWYYYYYRDFERGYDLRLLVKSKVEGERVTKAVLSIQGHPFNKDFVDFPEHDRTYSLNPGTQLVYGQQTKKPIERPRVDVRFRSAQLLLHGRLKAINLVATPESRLKQVIERLSVV